MGLTVATEQFPSTIKRGTETEVFALADAVWLAGLMLVPGDVLVLAVATGGLAGRALRQTAPLKIAFNVGQYVVAISVAVALYAAAGVLDPLSPGGWIVAVAAMFSFFLVNTGAVAAVIALVQDESFGRVLLPTLPLSALHWAGNMAIGLLAVIVAIANPAGLPLVLAPLALSYFGYRGWMRTLQERDEMRAMAATAESISEQGDLSRRIPIPDRDDEVGRLAATFNAMLDRLEGAFDRERRFLSEASHELRTPITICRGHLEVLLAQHPPSNVAESIDVVVDELKRMGRIVEDMITIAQMEQPQLLRLEQVELGSLLRDVGAKAQPLFDGRLRLCADEAAVVRADPQRLTQALLNLLHNAAVHAPSSEVTLRLTNDGSAWRVEVADQGDGLPAGQEDELFEPFRRATRQPGTGLGLAIVRAIAEAHHGAAGVSNRPGRGATFWMRLPK